MRHMILDTVNLAARKSCLCKCQSTTENKGQNPRDSMELWLFSNNYLAIICIRRGQAEETWCQ